MLTSTILVNYRGMYFLTAMFSQTCSSYSIASGAFCNNNKSKYIEKPFHYISYKLARRSGSCVSR